MARIGNDLSSGLEWRCQLLARKDGELDRGTHHGVQLAAQTKVNTLIEDSGSQLNGRIADKPFGSVESRNPLN